MSIGRSNRNLRQESRRNLPSCGCKSMTAGPRKMRDVFFNLLCTYAMPNKHYNSKPASPRWHLMAKRCLEVGRNRKIRKTEARNLPPCGCKSMVEGLRIMLNVFINLLCTYIICQTSTTIASLHLWGATWWPNILPGSRHRNRNLRQEICPHVAVKVWWRALEICWMCSSWTCYAHI